MNSGLNLQKSCHIIHCFGVPPSLSSAIQLNGRVIQIGQTEDCEIYELALAVQMVQGGRTVSLDPKAEQAAQYRASLFEDPDALLELRHRTPNKRSAGTPAKGFDYRLEESPEEEENLEEMRRVMDGRPPIVTPKKRKAPDSASVSGRETRPDKRLRQGAAGQASPTPKGKNSKNRVS
ncbi:hypothetical protein EJ04DRAFT_526456 [Polyplosphaeria fusca]|uniref:Uncharacterized protein n=1 Tax=Polyplosphaeria fusca TaxID=682080 RepID=A0A9P4QU39_9PLEO|nr:hypothetical protein EJ04DRAFT_526456 [Polyplosphaeria fusca]